MPKKENIATPSEILEGANQTEDLGSCMEFIGDDERLVHRIGKTKIYYRRIPKSITNKFVRQHTKKGKTDWSEVTSETLRYIVLGWENAKLNGQIIDFNPELISRFPGDVILELLTLSGASDTEEEAKN